MKKNDRLLVQVGVRVSVFFLVLIFVLSFVIYTGSTSLFLEGKNDMLDRDLTRIRNEINMIPEMPEVFDIWTEHPEKMIGELPEEEEQRLTESIKEKDDFTYSAFREYTAEEKIYAARSIYEIVSGWLNYEMYSFNYESMFIMDISERNRGFICCTGSSDISSINQSLGQMKEIDLSQHPAINKILSGSSRVTEYEVFNDEGGKSFYIGYIPLETGEKVKHVVCIEYDWSPFKKTLVENLVIMAGLILVIISAAGALLIGYIRKAAVVPAVKIQKSVHEYMDTKDSSQVVRQLGGITARNELGVLSHDIAGLAEELDDYISKLKNSGEEMKKFTEQVMEALAHTIDAKDKYTNGHSERVAIYSRMIAMHLGLSSEEQEKVYYMGLLHDIGKIGIPNAIINKASKLDDDEFELVQSHPILGYEILKEIRSMPDLALAARWHHELYDGTGYPDRKKGDEIPFLVRIIAVADSYDAMTSNRSYRKYIPQAEARAEIEKNIGKQFDPQVAECMLKIIDSDTSYALHE